MSRKSTNYGIPQWAQRKGKKLLDALDGSEIYEREATTRIQEGKYIHKANFESITELQRLESIKRRTA